MKSEKRNFRLSWKISEKIPIFLLNYFFRSSREKISRSLKNPYFPATFWAMVSFNKGAVKKGAFIKGAVKKGER